MDLPGPPAHLTVRGVSALCAPGGRGVLHLQGLDEGAPCPSAKTRRGGGREPLT